LASFKTTTFSTGVGGGEDNCSLLLDEVEKKRNLLLLFELARPLEEGNSEKLDTP
jgi:hypothetical protein